MVPRRFSWLSEGEGPRRWRSNRRISNGCGGVVKAVRGDKARETGGRRGRFWVAGHRRIRRGTVITD